MTQVQDHKQDHKEVPDLFQLRQGLTLPQMKQRIAVAYAGAGLRHRVVAFYLQQVEARGLHQLEGFRGTAQWAGRHFAMSRREARELLAAGKALLELPRIDKAFAEGRLCWSKVRLLTRVARADHDAAWLKKATELSIDDLAMEVKLARPGEPPRDRDDRKGLPEVRLRLDAQMPPDVYAKWEQVRRKLANEAGRDLAEWECLDAMFDLMLSLEPEDDASGGGGPGKRKRRIASPYTVVVHRPCDDGSPATVETEDGPMPMSSVDAEEIGRAHV